MARRVVQLLIDDIEGGDADETVKFSLDGVEYEIDLNKKNATKLRGALEPYLQAGNRVAKTVTRGAAVGKRPSTAAAGEKQERAAIREWALQQGIQISDRGRIKQEIIDQYNSRHLTVASEETDESDDAEPVVPTQPTGTVRRGRGKKKEEQAVPEAAFSS